MIDYGKPDLDDYSYLLWVVAELDYCAAFRYLKQFHAVVTAFRDRIAQVGPERLQFTAKEKRQWVAICQAALTETKHETLAQHRAKIVAFWTAYQEKN